MRITVTNKLTANKTPERSAFTITAAFFDDANEVWATSTPTTADYRIDRIRRGDPSSYDTVLDWTTLTPATSISIPITSTHNVIGDDYRRDEQRLITVRANAGLATQYQEVMRYSVTNLAAQT